NGSLSIAASTTIDSLGQFAGTFTAPSPSGTYSFQARYVGASQGSGPSQINWQTSNSDCQTITINSNTASISGTVFQDSNGNGSLDAGEPGISGVSVSLSGTSSGSATTNGSGVYTFSSVVAGNYSADYTVPTGYANTGVKPIPTFAVAGG